MTGFVYCLTNASIPGLVKIGKTKRDPKARAAEISGSTGVPTPFDIKWSREVHDMDKAESDLHAALERARLSKRREFFRCTPAQAYSATKSLKSFNAVKRKRAAQAGKPVLKPAQRRRRYDAPLGLSLTIATVAIFGGAVLFDLDASTVATATAGIGLVLTVMFQSAPLIGALRR